MFKSRIILKILAFSLLLMPGVAFALAGKIEKVSAGSGINILRAGKQLHLKVGDGLEAGDELSTDANTAVDIRLEDDSLIRVGVNSSYKIQEDSKLKSLVHRLISGAVWVLVTPASSDHSNAPKIKFRMDTPEGSIGVRGTEFVVFQKQGKTQLKGLDGEVVFGAPGADLAAAGGNTVMIERGFESEIAAGAASPKRPEKFDLNQYRNTLSTGKDPHFGASNAHGSGSATPNRYSRKATAPVVVADSAPPSAPPAKAPARSNLQKALQDQPQQATDWQAKLVAAALSGDQAGAQEALNHGAKVNGTAQGYTPLDAALLSDQGTAEIMAFLIKNHADVNQQNESGETPLMMVASKGLDLSLAQGLVCPGGAKLDVKTKDGKTAADLAAENGNDEVSSYLKSKKAAVDYERASTGSPCGK